MEREVASEMAAQMEWQRSLRQSRFAQGRRRGGRCRVFGDFPLVAERSGSGGEANQCRARVAPRLFTAHFFANSSKTGG